MRFDVGDQNRTRTFEPIAMADIVFLLLIFFLLSSSFVMQTGIKVNLPEVVSPELQPREHVVVTLNREGQVFLNEKQVSWEDLPFAMEELIARVTSGVVVIRGDRDVSLGYTVKAMEIAKASGAQRLAVAVKPSYVERQDQS